jgi:hypothetical protein
MLTRLRINWLALPLASRWAVIVWAALVGGVLGRVVASKPRSQTVVPIYLVAGQRWVASKDLFEPIPGLDLFRYPPVVAAAFVPFSEMPEKLAEVLWRGLSVAVFLMGLWRFRRTLATELTPTRAGLLFALAALLVVQALNNGQANLLLAGAVLNGAAAVARGRWWEAAAWFGLAGWLKLYTFAFGLLVGLLHPRQFGPRLLAVTLVGAALPFACQAPDYVLSQYREFVENLGADDRTYANLYRTTRDWAICPRVWFDWNPPPSVRTAVSLVAALAAAGLVRCAASRRDALFLAILLGSVWITAFGPATESNTYSVLAGVAAYLVVWPNPRPRWATAAAWAGYALLAATILRGLSPADWKFQVLGPQPVGTLLLAAAGVATVFTRALTSRELKPQTWFGRVVIRGRNRLAEPVPLPETR